ncbi:MAG TPA: glycosyltransferase family 4 protein [Jatrophihabitans sp.]|nr:glycosyltransferase family 4 protein [Jatrophihabitans sp.]
MRIGLIAPPWLTVPPLGYGGTEAVVDNLARGLHDAGHEVCLYTVGTSTCPVPRRAHYPRPVEPMSEGSYEAAHVLAAYEALRGVDLIHDHTTLGPLIAKQRGLTAVPVLTTLHLPLRPEIRSILAAAEVDTAAISHAQARAAAPLPITGVVHHGIDLDTYRYGPGGGGYLLFMGRMSPDKGVHRAIEVARRAGRRLVIVSRIQEAGERAYYREVVQPLLGPDDEPPEAGTIAERIELLRHADALLNPIDWPEPFGLVMAEALACGTPVLAFPNGAAPEIVDDGRTGYLCADEDELVAAVARVADLDRRSCRRAAELRFSAGRMTADYLRLYSRLLHPARLGPTARVHPGIAEVASRQLTG